MHSDVKQPTKWGGLVKWGTPAQLPGLVIYILHEDSATQKDTPVRVQSSEVKELESQEEQTIGRGQKRPKSIKSFPPNSLEFRDKHPPKDGAKAPGGHPVEYKTDANPGRWGVFKCDDSVP